MRWRAVPLRTRHSSTASEAAPPSRTRGRNGPRIPVSLTLCWAPFEKFEELFYLVRIVGLYFVFFFAGLNRSGSFVSPRKDASDDSMHEKYFKSVESTPLTRRKVLLTYFIVLPFKTKYFVKSVA